jgi:hypothetical protein
VKDFLRRELEGKFLENQASLYMKTKNMGKSQKARISA